MISLKKIKARINEKNLFEIDEFIFKDFNKYVLLGENGSGKSSLLKYFINMTDIVEGEFFTDKEIIYQAQDSYLFKNTARDNFKLLNVKPEKFIEEMKLLNIDKLLDQRVDKLSGGESQKFVFLRSLAVCKETLILDEPFSQMDEKSKIIADKILDNWLASDKNKMIIMVSHDNQKNYSYDHLLELKDGSLREICI